MSVRPRSANVSISVLSIALFTGSVTWHTSMYEFNAVQHCCLFCLLPVIVIYSRVCYRLSCMLSQNARHYHVKKQLMNPWESIAVPGM
jgi:hypothetical protein